MAKIKITHYTVRGSGSFPADMLRYDQSWPERSEDAVEIGARYDHRLMSEGPRDIRLVTHGVITPGRWSSFGWQVTDQRTTTY